MARGSGFGSPFLLGFDRLEDRLEQLGKAAGDGYPPYNIEQISDQILRITIAVAGFRRDDISIICEDEQLIIKGKTPVTEDRVYIHRGIAARQFVRKFLIADGLLVQEASMANGLLNIDLARPEPKQQRREIPIS